MAGAEPSGNGVSRRPDVGWWGQVLCGVLGHSYPVRMATERDILCDCPTDHTYPGCVRCGTGMAVAPWWNVPVARRTSDGEESDERD